MPVGFPKPEYQSGLPFPSPGDLPDTEIKPASLALTGRFFTPGPPGKPCDYSESEITQPCLTTPWTIASKLLHPWDFPGKSTGVGCHFLLQGTFQTQGSNLALLHCRQTLLHISHQESLRVGDYSGPTQIIQDNHSISRHGTKHV